MPGLTAAARLVDQSATSRVLVHGSPPPEGRDLDVLVTADDASGIGAALRADGFERHGSHWARFSGGVAAVVELTPSSYWRLPPEEERALFEEARPLADFRRLVVPSPRHELLLLARDVVGGAGELGIRRRARIAAALAEDRHAWTTARAHADAWGGAAELYLLRRAYDANARLSYVERVGAVASRLRRQGEDPISAYVAAARLLVARPRIGHVIALSGLDGAGKTTQARLLVDTLQRLGYDAVTEWTRLAAEGWIWELRHRLARILAAALRRRGSPVRPGSGEPDAVTELRQSSRVLTEAWASFVALANAAAHQRAVAGHLAAGRIVVCDRWVLDSVVHLRARFGAHRKWRLQTSLIRWLSPRPLRAFLLDLPAAAAQGRKQEDDPAWLELLSQLYGAETESGTVRRLDAERPVEDIAAAVARDVWEALAGAAAVPAESERRLVEP